MIESIDACSFDEAFEFFIGDYPEFKTLKFVDIGDVEGVGSLDRYEDLGIVFYYMAQKPGKNVNKIQTSVVDFPSKGEKKWETKYLVIDRFGNLLLNNTDFKIKKDAVDAAREYTAENYINSKVIIGKSALNFSRTQSEIKYKPSLEQTDGRFIFIF